MNPLLTLVQISDLHIGAIDPQTSNAQSSQAVALMFASSSCFDGVLGHHGRGLQDLAAFVKQMDASGEPWRLIVTGDLTQYGDGIQFDNAADFLAVQLDINPPKGNYVGLKRGAWRPGAIPGNHDQWPGAPVIFGGPHPHLVSYFPASSLPFITDISLANGRILRFIGIDTDADVSPNRLERFRAVGSFQTQLSKIAPQLGAAEPEEIRVLLMHHSWDHRGKILEINAATRGALASFLSAHGIRLVLTGHTHESLIKPFVPVAGGPTVLECRSGTTTQIDQPPYHWRSLFGGFPASRWPANSLLVHRLTDQKGSVRWEVETYTRSDAHGFRRVTGGSFIRDVIVV